MFLPYVCVFISSVLFPLQTLTNTQIDSKHQCEVIKKSSVIVRDTYLNKW